MTYYIIGSSDRYFYFLDLLHRFYGTGGQDVKKIILERLYINFELMRNNKKLRYIK